MKNLICINDFKNPYLVTAVSGTESEEILDALIEEYQKKILLKILGAREYKELTENITDTEWVAFIDGATYTDTNGVEFVYEGIKPVLARFMYYYWQRFYNDELADNGAVNVNLQNAKKVIPVDKMVSAYNSACDLIYDYSDQYAPTVYRFLEHYQTLTYFPDLDYNKIEKINGFNL